MMVNIINYTLTAIFIGGALLFIFFSRDQWSEIIERTDPDIGDVDNVDTGKESYIDE